jgi:hypothetical protein
MKAALATLAVLLAASGSALGESTPAPAARNDQAEKQTRKPAAKKPEPKPTAQESFVPGGVAHSFVIPKNTCESGTSIQKLLTDKPKQ